MLVPEGNKSFCLFDFLLNIDGQQLRYLTSGRSVILSTFFLGRLNPSLALHGCTHFG